MKDYLKTAAKTKVITTAKIITISFVLSAASFANAECTAPETPSMPDGASSAMEDMITGQKAVKTFQAANLEYMTCLEPLIAAATEKATGADASAEDTAAIKSLEERYNSAVSAEEELAGQFNTEIRDYKAANPS